jgi:hypothetical protein
MVRTRIYLEKTFLSHFNVFKIGLSQIYVFQIDSSSHRFSPWRSERKTMGPVSPSETLKEEEVTLICKSQVINIHHSFLPAFVGSKPYHRAHARGVKLVGATAHYATAELDEGPIIEQDCARISHKHSIDDLLRKGRVLEKNVLVSAVRAHLEDRIIVYQNKCVVFGD